MAEERLAGTGIRVLLLPRATTTSSRSTTSSRPRPFVELGEGRVVDIDGFQMVSTGWANRTPWHTYREEDEPDLRMRLENAISQVTAPPEREGLQLPLPAVPARGSTTRRS